MFVSSNPGVVVWVLKTADFSGIQGVNDNPHFAIRLVTAVPTGSTAYQATGSGNYGSGGTIRFDNIYFYYTETDDISTPVATPAGGTYHDPIYVELSTLTQDVRIYFTTNGTDPSSTNGTLYTAPIRINQTTTLKFIAESDGLKPSVIVTEDYVLPIAINSLAELREGTQGTLYRIVNEVVVTFAQDWRNQKFVQDNTDAILIDDLIGIIATEYMIGDGMRGLLATLGSHGGALQLQPVVDPSSPSSTGNQIEPKIITMERFINNFQTYNFHLVTIRGVSFIETTESFFNGQVYAITDGDFFINMRATFFDVDYIRQPIPAGIFDMTGIVNSRVDGGELHQFITPRFADDMYMTVSEADIVTVPGHKLIGNYPNPFNPSTSIAFYLDRDTNVNVTIFNIRGQQVRMLVNGSFTAGHHHISWDGKDDNAQFMASGVYFYIMETSESAHFRKAILIK